jgi:hypothetical protein
MAVPNTRELAEGIAKDLRPRLAIEPRLEPGGTVQHQYSPVPGGAQAYRAPRDLFGRRASPFSERLPLIDLANGSLKGLMGSVAHWLSAVACTNLLGLWRFEFNRHRCFRHVVRPYRDFKITARKLKLS